MQGPSPLGRQLSSSPSDGISNLRFSAYSDNLIVSSWDGSVRLFDVSSDVVRGSYKTRTPVLDCCFHDDTSAFIAGSDHTVKRFDFNVMREDVLGRHDAPVRCVEFSHVTGQVVTGGWDHTLRCWDPRGPFGGSPAVASGQLPDRAYSMSLVDHTLVVATAARHVWVYDLRRMPHPEQRRESSLKYQTRCGRVAMEYFDTSETSQAKNGLAASGTCVRLRLPYTQYPTSIAALSFSRDGRLLAVASSYTFEMGDIPHERDSVYVRAVNDVEVKPKPKV
eukprot:jgi/Mesen1/9682/ME000680S09083